MRIFLEPNPGKSPDSACGGIRRVLDAQIKYLPEFGVTITKKIDKADLTVGHVDHLPIAEGKPFVSHNHGLMWSDYFDDAGNREVNRSVVNAITQADAFTVPSQWVAHAFSYGLLKVPHVIYHGIELDEWLLQAEHGNYVLWNKARADAVSDPSDMLKLARLMPNAQFISTIGKESPNVKIVGVAPYEQHKTLVQNAGVYLATARETFGIGTLEALASGVPVAGWDYGGQSEIIINGETGYLAPYGDYSALAECVNRCFKERARLSQAAREDVVRRWQWKDKIEQYANLYKAVVNDWTKPRPKVSVIVPCHNLAKYLPDALNSLLRQTLQDWECIIVDDASTDNSWQVACGFQDADKRFTPMQPQNNLGLSRALNLGHADARGKYVMNLDADNILPENTLAILSDALDQRRDVHVVYGGLDTMNDDGTNRKPNAFPYPAFSWYEQIAHLNQLHSSAMMRREVMEASAGYRERQWRAEDAEFWTRVSSFGFRIERVTNEPTLIYRWRQGSKSSEERKIDPIGIDGDWCKCFAWRTADSGQNGQKAIAANPRGVANAHLVPFGAQGRRTDKNFWDAPHHQTPLVSVIIPVGNGHTRYLNDALDSLMGQLTNDWEAVVINDTDEDWTSVRGAPFARVIKNTTGKHGAGIAKNIGIDNARGKLVFFLDADDMLEPSALIKMIHRFASGDTCYVYCDALVPESPLKNREVAAPEYSQNLWVHNGLHTQAMLMPTEDARRLRFDEDLKAWEDWDFIVRCAINGVCGERVPEPLILYRKHLGQRSIYGSEHRAELTKFLHDRYDDYARGAKEMGKCGGCGNHKALQAIRDSRIAQTRVETLDKPLADGMVRLKYIGNKAAPVTYYANGHPYSAAQTPKWRMLDVPKADAEILKGFGIFVEIRVTPTEIIVPQAEPPQQTAASVPVAEIKPIEPPAVVAAPKVDAAKMAEAVRAMEAATGERIQPKVKEAVVIEAGKTVETSVPAEPQNPIARTYRKPRGKK